MGNSSVDKKKAASGSQQTENNKLGKRIPVWMLVLTDITLTCFSLGIFLLYHYVLPRHLAAEEIVVATADDEEAAFVLPGSESTGDADTAGNKLAGNTGNAGNTDGSSSDASAASGNNPGAGTGSGTADPNNDILAADTSKDIETQEIKGVNANGDITNFGNSDTFAVEANQAESSYIGTQEKKVTRVNSYSSDNLQFHTDKVEVGSGTDKITYYVSDVYVTNVKYLKTAFAQGNYGKNIRESTLKQAADNGALLAINGDFYGNSEKGLVIRNGVLYRSDIYDADICILFTDGTMKTYSPEDFKADDVLEQGVWQAWIFGPQLLDGKGNILSSFNSTYYLSEQHPRTAIGYVEPGHYVFLVVDGRNEGYSRGASLSELAQIMVDAGCVYAYNLDGGQSAEMAYGGEYVNRPSQGGRDVSDIIYLSE